MLRIVFLVPFGWQQEREIPCNRFGFDSSKRHPFGAIPATSFGVVLLSGGYEQLQKEALVRHVALLVRLWGDICSTWGASGTPLARFWATCGRPGASNGALGCVKNPR